MAVTKELQDAITKMQAKDETAFAIFYEQTYSYVYSKAKYIMHEEDDALDLTQETYIQAYRGIGSIEDVNNVYAWLGGIVYRQGMRIFNKKKELLTGEEQDYLFEDIESNEATPEQTVEQQATADIVKGMIDELPEQQRVAVMAFYYDNMKIDEIASMCECSANTIKSRLNYAKKYLKEKVEAHEKQNRYKLCSVSPAIILLALRGLFAESQYKMPVQAIKGVYMAACDNLGIQAVSSVIAGGGASVSAGAVAGGSASVSTGAVAAGTAATVKAGIGIKIGLTVAAILAAGGITVGVIHNVNNATPKEPVTVIEEQTRSDEQPSTEIQTEESIYDESIPMEGLYKFWTDTISITNAKVENYLNATFDMEFTFTDPETGVVETASATSVKKENGKAVIDIKSDLGRRWFGQLIFLYDNSVRADLCIQDTDGNVWDRIWGSINILTKAEADGIIQNRMPAEGTYSYTEGTDVSVDGGYILTISDVDADSFKMSFQIVSREGKKVDILETYDESILMKNGIATFFGDTGWDVGMHGYLYVNDDGSISLSYTAMSGADKVPWYGAYPDGCFEPIILKK